MPVKYKLIQRRNLGKDKEQNPQKFYAQAVNNGTETFLELCAEVAETCSLTSADVKAVIDRMNYVLDKHLKSGRIVQLGEIGNFRLGVGSTGSLTEDAFNTSMIKKPRIIFTPGKKLQLTRLQTNYEKLVVNVKPSAGGGTSPSVPEV